MKSRAVLFLTLMLLAIDPTGAFHRAIARNSRKIQLKFVSAHHSCCCVETKNFHSKQLVSTCVQSSIWAAAGDSSHHRTSTVRCSDNSAYSIWFNADVATVTAFMSHDYDAE